MYGWLILDDTGNSHGLHEAILFIQQHHGLPSQGYIVSEEIMVFGRWISSNAAA